MSAIKKREEIASEYKWKLEDIYSDEQLWEEDFNAIKKLAQEVDGLKGTLSSSDTALLKVLQISDELGQKSEKIYVYARMRRDENNANPRYQALFDRAEGLSVQVGSITSFIVPEILSISTAALENFLQVNQALAVYRHSIEEIVRQKEHILSPEEERLLAMTADISMASGNIFTMLNNADIKFPLIKDESGNEMELTKGRYGGFMESSDRRVRQDAFTGLYDSYGRLINTLGASLSSSVKKDVFYARVRKYNSAREASLDQDNVPVEVYDRLIDSVHEHLDYMYRYMAIRKKLLKLDELHFYDIYTPLVPEYKMEIPYAKAQETLLNALQPLGAEYISRLREGFSAGWIDVYENEGKTSGAYSWGSYETNPYVLLNYDNKLDDMFTLAHEMGHSMHSWYSNHAQPFVYSHYSIFVAEVASTVNESLLIDYLLKNSQDKQEKIYLINHYLEQFRGTVYRQAMFAEYEKIIHEHSEKGEALTPEFLKQSYRDLNLLYYGPEIVIDEEIELEWARIPHFYSAFYVYKYATGFSTATALKEQIISEGQPAVERYLNFLKSGSSDYPINLLKNAGVDLLTPEPVTDALQYFGKLLDELEELLK
ncbi:MAG: oligoendopeptidase F [Firmicutes bacterium HGW-Firmicutes-15]|nr:MAG: oligoendopeptidase F [Firmicutes bacterium HGW-Firmicutes-15]